MRERENERERVKRPLFIKRNKFSGLNVEITCVSTFFLLLKLGFLII